MSQRPALQNVRPMSNPSAAASAGGTGDSPLVGQVSDEPLIRGAGPNAFLAWESPEYGRFVNMIMMDGKKEVARKALWNALMRLRDGGHDPSEVFYSAIDNVRPMMEMRTFKSGAVPFPLNPRRAEGQAMKWIVAAARKRKGQAFEKSLSAELLSASQHKGSAILKKQEVHKTAVANQVSPTKQVHGMRPAPYPPLSPGIIPSSLEPCGPWLCASER